MPSVCGLLRNSTHACSVATTARPVVLNMANAYRAGGGFRTGAGAQEENLHRRTNLFQVCRSVSLCVFLAP